MRHLLDANIVIAFQLVGALEDLLHAAMTTPMALSEQVYDELTAPRGDSSADVRSRIAEAAGKLPGDIEILRPDASSPTGRTYLDFRTRRSDKNQRLQRNRGEDESLAIAVHEEDIIYVCHDGEAFRDAANELGSTRIITFHFFLRMLVERAALSALDADLIAKRLETLKGTDRRRDQAYARPLWWADWMLTQLSPRKLGEPSPSYPETGPP
jgi:hypothetical protein